MSQRPSMNPFRLQYLTPAGEVKWTEPVADRHSAQVLALQLTMEGNKVEYQFRDYVGNPLVGPFPAQYGMPWQAYVLGCGRAIRRVC